MDGSRGEHEVDATFGARPAGRPPAHADRRRRVGVLRLVLAGLAGGIVLGAVVVGCREASSGPGGGDGGPLRAEVGRGAVVDALGRAGLVRDGRVDVAAVRAVTEALRPDAPGRTPRYDRDAYGPAWADSDGDGCDQRDQVLRRDLTAVAVASPDDPCTVVGGRLDDAYTGRGIDFRRGARTSAAVQIDHLVPLSWAWRHGASAWSDGVREQLATDLDELQAVDGPTNQDKSDQGPATWLPPDPDYRCLYVTRFAFVVGSYRLTIDDADRRAIERTLDACS